jgi:hypothetical protein
VLNNICQQDKSASINRNCSPYTNYFILTKHNAVQYNMPSPSLIQPSTTTTPPPKEIVDELRKDVEELPKDVDPSDFDSPPGHIYIRNPASGCSGTFWVLSSQGEEGVFRFVHNSQDASACQCIIRRAGEEVTTPTGLPDYMDIYRLDILLGRSVPYRLEPMLAAMAVLKIYLGIEVPRVLRSMTAAAIRPAPPISSGRGGGNGGSGGSGGNPGNPKNGNASPGMTMQKRV